VELYCHSSQREKKEQGIAELFAKRFEAALATLAEGLHKKGAVKRYEKVLERLGRLREKYHGRHNSTTSASRTIPTAARPPRSPVSVPNPSPRPCPVSIACDQPSGLG
jgi:uncharacterized membrane protein YccC